MVVSQHHPDINSLLEQSRYVSCKSIMGLLPDTQNCGLRMRWECRERFPRHRFQRKLLVSDPDMHHGTCVMHVGIAKPRWRGKTFPAFPAHAQLAILRIWQEAHCPAAGHVAWNNSLLGNACTMALLLRGTVWCSRKVIKSCTNYSLVWLTTWIYCTCASIKKHNCEDYLIFRLP